MAELSLSDRRVALDAAVSALSGLSEVLWQAGNDELGPLLRQIDDVGRWVESARVAVLSEAMERGVTSTTMARGTHGWVVEWAPSLRGAGAGQLVEVTKACRQQRHAPVREALLEARVSVRGGAVCLGEMARMEHRLCPEAVPTVWAGLLSLAQEEGPREVRRLRPALLARYGQPGELEKDQQRAKQLVSLSQAMAAGDGLFEYSLVLDAEGRAVLEAALGPVSAPCPADGVPDLRPAGQRRAEGLVTLLRRAVACPEGVPTSPKSMVLVTIDWQDLVRESGAGATTGGTDDGSLLGAGTVRRLACDAGVLPVVLGGRGEVLDLGREWRYFTGAQAKALWLRDRRCTMAGCGMPASWCDAHHLWHWCDGGPTDLEFGALLCGYHHTWVHRHRLAGRVVGGQVVWDLTPGSYDTYLREVRAGRDAGRGGPPGDQDGKERL